jgi:6-phosphogluconolactonase
MKNLTSADATFNDRLTVRKLPDPESLAATVANEWLKELGMASEQTEAYLVALSGGRIARQFFAEVARVAKGQTKIFDRVHFFWGDERCVLPDDPESNFRMARELLLEPLRIPKDHIHRVLGEDLPSQAAADAEAELRRVAAHSTLNAQPEFDMIFLGMGEEGHVASLFPGESEDVMASPAVYRPVLASKPPPQRITLGYPAIATARQVWLLASGDGKEQALTESLSSKGRTPLARVLKLREQTRIYTDISV